MRVMPEAGYLRTEVRPTVLFCSLAFVLATGSYAHAQGGPPLITDDPDTPGPSYWEINIPMILESSAEGRHFDAPFPDINYGVGKRIQLKFEMPWVTVAPREQPIQTGIGNSNSGVKWRFLGQEEKVVSWSIYPQLEVNTSESSVTKGLVERHAQFFFPTEFTVRRGRVEINGEVGRLFVKDDKDGWAAGITTEIEINRGLEVLGEVHWERDGDLPVDAIVNVGARKAVSEKIWFLGSIGTGLHGQADERVHLRIYAGIQLNLPKQYHASASGASPPAK
jgi:hypothetical protein